jgi:hypothetical protein
VNVQLTALKAALRSDLAVLGEQVELAAQHLAVPKAGDPTQAEAHVQVCLCYYLSAVTTVQTVRADGPSGKHPVCGAALMVVGFCR